MKYTTTKKCLINFPFQPPNDWGMPSIGEGMLFSWIYEVPDRVWRTIPSTSVKNDWSWNSVWDWRSQLLTLRSGRHWLERVFFNWSGQSVREGAGKEQGYRVRDWPHGLTVGEHHGGRVDGTTPQRRVEGGLWWVWQGEQGVLYWEAK